MYVYISCKSLHDRKAVLVCGQGQKDTTPPCGCAPALARLVIIGYLLGMDKSNCNWKRRGAAALCPPLPPIVAFAPATTPQKQKSHHTLTLWSFG